MEACLFAYQRLTAMVMAIFVCVHLVLIIYAVHSGLTVDALLSRTQGNGFWIAFYGLFVLSVSVHVPIGIRNILIEWLKLGRPTASGVGVVFGLVLLGLGLRAVAAVGGLLS